MKGTLTRSFYFNLIDLAITRMISRTIISTLGQFKLTPTVCENNDKSQTVDQCVCNISVCLSAVC